MRAKLSAIDFSDESSERTRAVQSAFVNDGFLIARNLGISDALLASVFDASRAFFADTPEHKARVAYRSAAENFGYQGLLQERLDPAAPADLKETFTMRNIVNRPLHAERWPSTEFQALMTEFYEQGYAAASRLGELIADALDLPHQFFRERHSGENVTLRILHYPALGDSAVAAGQLGAGAHTDYGMLTLLFQDRVGGLQIESEDGRWLDVETEPNEIIINCGDLLERWTNGLYRSTCHRVQPRVGQSDRLSIALFVDPDSDVLVQSIPSCVTEARPLRYAPTTAGAHIQERIERSHGDPRT